jgi:tetratricopeptide (TPR) repeat protein
VEPLRRAERAAWYAHLEREHANLWAALGWALESGDATTGFRLVWALRRFWGAGYLHEGGAWVERVLACDAAHGATAPRLLRARALWVAGAVAEEQHDPARAAGFFEQSLAVYRELGDEEGVARAGGHLGIALGYLGDYDSAAMLLEESLTIMRAPQNVHDTAMALMHLGHVVWKQGDERRAAALLEESIALLRQIGEMLALTRALIMQAELVQARGDAPRAAVLLEESVRLCRELGDNQGHAEALHHLGRVAYAQGDHDQALARCADALALARAVEDGQISTMIERTIDAVMRRQDVGSL